MDQLLNQLVTGLSGTLVYGAIALVTLVGVIKCIYPVLRNSALLNRAIMKLERSAAGNERPIWREARFLGRALRPDWQRFLLNAGQLDLRGMPCNTEEYINEDTVIYKPGHAQLSELIPSLLTSLGILGTFIGLMVGLADLDLADASKTIASIPTLLGGMRFAFATSVAGISCSISFNMINRMAVGHAFKALDSFDEAFYELAMPRPLDPEVQMICQKQDDELNLQRAADQVGGQMAAAMEMAMSRAVHPLTMSMDNFIQGATREQVDGVGRIVNQFVHQMNNSMNGQFSALSDTLALLNQTQGAAQQNLQRVLKVTEALVDDARRIQQSSHAFATAMEHETPTLSQQKQEELLALLRETVNQQTTVARNLGGLQSELTEALRNLDVRAKISAQDTQQTDQNEAMTDAMNRMSESIDLLTAKLNGSQPDTRGKVKNRKLPGMTGGV